MGIVFLDISMSLDGFITGANSSHDQPLGDGGERLHQWMHRKAPDVPLPNAASTGAVVTGRRTYDQVDGWNGSHPTGVKPVFVLTKDVPAQAPLGKSTFTFVTDGIRSAIAQAKAAAGDKDVYVLGGAKVAVACINAGLLDEVRIHIVHVLLAGGVWLFDAIDRNIDLKQTGVVDGSGVTHLVLRPERAAS